MLPLLMTSLYSTGNFKDVGWCSAQLALAVWLLAYTNFWKTLSNSSHYVNYGNISEVNEEAYT